VAEPEGAPRAAAESVGWRTIDELADLVGGYCWLEQRLFELAGEWASRPEETGGDGSVEDVGLAEARVWCAAVSRRHGTLAARWADRLPVRAGVDRAALMTAPAVTLAGALDRLAAEKDARTRVAALVTTVLPGVGGLYEAHLRQTSPVSEASVIEVLVEARRAVEGEIRGGRSLLQGRPAAAETTAELAGILERAFNDIRVFPAAPAS
jgi:hypothetical protein